MVGPAGVSIDAVRIDVRCKGILREVVSDISDGYRVKAKLFATKTAETTPHKDQALNMITL